jgi:Family of unknown function (DUF6298)
MPPLLGLALLAVVVAALPGATAADKLEPVAAARAAPRPAKPEPAPAVAKRVGSLRILRSNPRYFVDPSGKAVYLTGSHVWWNLLDQPCPMEGLSAPAARPRFDYNRYLEELVRYGHNLVRLWTWEFTFRGHDPCSAVVPVLPQPWLRTGPERAPDGLPRFDLTRFDPEYFARLRERVEAAKARGIYVAVMLFEGFGPQFTPGAWRYHPFQHENNVNDVEADADGDGFGREAYTLQVPAVTAVQDAYVRKVLETLADLDNVIYEVANESGGYSTDWQLRLIELIRDHEAKLGVRHPVGMTFQNSGGDNSTLWRSAADWISPGWMGYDNFPLPTGDKVVLSDTDHHCGICGDEAFVWKSFTRGHNVLLMDPLDRDPAREQARWAMGHTRRLAERIDLIKTRPFRRLSSTKFTLARPGYEYVVYQPLYGPFTVDLRAARRPLAVEWIHPVSGRSLRRGTVVGGAVRRFRPPFGGQAVLYLAARPR